MPSAAKTALGSIGFFSVMGLPPRKSATGSLIANEMRPAEAARLPPLTAAGHLGATPLTPETSTVAVSAAVACERARASGPRARLHVVAAEDVEGGRRS